MSNSYFYKRLYVFTPITITSMTDNTDEGDERKTTIGVVHKIRHVEFYRFGPRPLSLSHTFSDPLTNLTRPSPHK